MQDFAISNQKPIQTIEHLQTSADHKTTLSFENGIRKINKIFYFSVSRSDYYITYNLLNYLASKKNLKINTVITGMHYAKNIWKYQR